METARTQPLSLKRRCMGPRAVRIETLVQRAEAAMQNVVRDYALYARDRLAELRRLGAEALADPNQAATWAAFRNGLRDLQTSSAMAGSPWIARFAASLQGELARREPADRNLPVLVELHFDAIRVAASEAAPEAQLAELERNLEQAGLKLRP